MVPFQRPSTVQSINEGKTPWLSRATGTGPECDILPGTDLFTALALMNHSSEFAEDLLYSTDQQDDGNCPRGGNHVDDGGFMFGTCKKCGEMLD